MKLDYTLLNNMQIKNNTIYYVVVSLIITAFLVLAIFLFLSPLVHSAVALLAAVMAVALSLPVSFIAIRDLTRKNLRDQRSAYVAMFAHTNGLQYSRRVEVGERQGALFLLARKDISQSLPVLELIVADNQPFSEIGNLQVQIGDAMKIQGFVRIPLKNRLPHMLLDSKKNRLFEHSQIAATLATDQRVHLEGDFSDSFTIYAPKGYESDVRYVFTPNVMQAILESVQEFDAEVIDEDMYLYAQGKIDLANPKSYESIVSVAQAVTESFGRQSLRYVDSRSEDRSMIHDSGARLEKAKWPVLLAVMGVVMAFFAALVSRLFT